MASPHIHEVTDQNFDQTVLAADKPFLIDFWATWCAPCLAIAPHIESIANEMNGRVGVGKLNIDDNPGTAGKFGVRSIPTLIMFKGGKPVDQLVGAVPKAKLEEFIKRHT